MTYSEVEAFLAVIENRSITRAAETLFVSQSTLSGRISSLERELGAVLINRGKGIRHVELTQHGQLFLPIAKKWVALWDDTKSAMEREPYRMLQTSSIQSISTYIMPEVCINYMKANPDVRLHQVTHRSADSYSLIENGHAEAAFTSKPQYSAKVNTTLLYTEKMYLVCGSNDKYKDGVRPSELDVNNEVYLDWDMEHAEWHKYWFGENGIPKLYIDNIRLMASFLMEQANTWAIVPISVLRAFGEYGGIRRCRMKEAPKNRKIYMLTRRGEEYSGELKAFLLDMKSVMLEHGAQWVFDN